MANRNNFPAGIGGSKPFEQCIKCLGMADPFATQCLAILARWMLDAEAAGLSWGLRMPNYRLDPDMGKEQLATGLRILALFGTPDQISAVVGSNGTQ